MKMMNKNKNRLGFIGLMVVLLCLLILPFIVAGQDTALHQIPVGVTVCRDPRFETVRLEFHHIPDDWINTAGYWFLAGGANMIERAGDNVFVADALTTYEPNELWIKAGVVVIGTQDYAYEMRGDEHAVLCNPDESPVQTDMPSVLARGPDYSGTIQCDHRAVDSATGSDYCYVPNSDGTIPLPPGQ